MKRFKSRHTRTCEEKYETIGGDDTSCYRLLHVDKHCGGKRKDGDWEEIIIQLNSQDYKSTVLTTYFYQNTTQPITTHQDKSHKKETRIKERKVSKIGEKEAKVAKEAKWVKETKEARRQFKKEAT